MSPLMLAPVNDCDMRPENQRVLVQSTQVGVKTAVASASAAAFRIFLMPVDAMKTTMQVGKPAREIP